MNITFKVDQAAALKAGINAPTSTVKLDIDPAELTQQEREFLASALTDGYDATKRGGISSFDPNTRSSALYLLRPDLQGVREAIALRYAQLESDRAAAEQRSLIRRQEVDRDISAAMAAVDSENIPVGMVDGELGTDHYRVYRVRTKVRVPKLQYFGTSTLSDASPEVREQYVSASSAIQVERERLIESARPELERLQSEANAIREAEQAQYDALYARLPEALRVRLKAGYATSTEVTEGIESLLRQDAGFPAELESWNDEADLKVLTDAQFARLLQVESSAPEGAEVQPVRIKRVTYRPAQDGEYGDDDGEIAVNTYSDVVLLEWSRGGVTAQAIVPLDE